MQQYPKIFCNFVQKVLAKNRYDIFLIEQTYKLDDNAEATNPYFTYSLDSTSGDYVFCDAEGTEVERVHFEKGKKQLIDLNFDYIKELFTLVVDTEVYNYNSESDIVFSDTAYNHTYIYGGTNDIDSIPDIYHSISFSLNSFTPDIVKNSSYNIKYEVTCSKCGYNRTITPRYYHYDYDIWEHNCKGDNCTYKVLIKYFMKYDYDSLVDVSNDGFDASRTTIPIKYQVKSGEVGFGDPIYTSFKEFDLPIEVGKKYIVEGATTYNGYVLEPVEPVVFEYGDDVTGITFKYTKILKYEIDKHNTDGVDILRTPATSDTVVPDVTILIGALFLVGVLGNELLNIVAGIFFSARSVLVVIGLIVVVLLVVGL